MLVRWKVLHAGENVKNDRKFCFPYNRQHRTSIVVRRNVVYNSIDAIAELQTFLAPKRLRLRAVSFPDPFPPDSGMISHLRS